MTSENPEVKHDLWLLIAAILWMGINAFLYAAAHFVMMKNVPHYFSWQSYLFGGATLSLIFGLVGLTLHEELKKKK